MIEPGAPRAALRRLAASRRARGAAPRAPRGIYGQRKGAALVCVLALAGPVGAGPLWETFEARCLTPYEHLALPDTRGLTQAAGRWSDGDAIDLELTPETCTALGVAEGSLGDLLATREHPYEEVAPGIWHSDRWREPRLEVTAGPDRFTARETDLES